MPLLTARLAGPALALVLTLPWGAPLRAATDAAACALEWQVRLTTATLPDAERPAGRAVPALDVTLGFDAGTRTSTRLRLPAGWDALRELNPDAPRLLPVAGDAQLRQVQHAAQARVLLQWRLVPGTDTGGTAGLRLTPDWSAFTGAAVLAWPEEPGTQTLPACLRVEAGDTVRWISNFGRAEGSAARWSWPAATAGQVQQALYAGGALQWRDADAAGQTLTAVVPAGAALAFDAAALAERAARLQTALRRDWRDDERTPIPVLALPGPVAGGMTLGRALALQAPPDLALPGPQADELIAGQLLRRWMPERFGPLAHAGRGDGPLRAWFTEGFADYLAHRLLLKEGLWTPEDYAAALNRKIARYQAQPERAADNLRLATGGAGAQALAELPAARGEWLALHWNAALREAGRPGLEATLRGLMVPAAQARREGPLSTPLATHRLIAALRRDLGDVPLRELAHHIEDGAPFEFPPTALGPCFQRDAAPASFRPVAQAAGQPACQGWLQGSGTERVAAANGKTAKTAKTGKAAKAVAGGKAGKSAKTGGGRGGKPAAAKAGKSGAGAKKAAGAAGQGKAKARH
ncbi:hypothetical protein AACH10_09440 [Ideonella sp. DXS22W]|uniref:Peptidase M61 catalytic domain-containing protein n=1 Tax=Pseudaquabacterium inlustre TaxID=2984192 RepID=A0ABU9CJ51_9BURK